MEKLLPEAQTKEPDALGQLASLGKSLRDLSKSAENIAREIDAIALNVEERIQKSSEETSKLRQLQ
ncbi:hypothetical protein, partial [Klebsiella pneumoniae]|uniref:hypothetical protein n=1 Tax=Klebsiella pneumoniae TaxID=573 RepID=UPI003A8BF129